jgi:hypothetical protein
MLSYDATRMVLEQLAATSASADLSCFEPSVSGLLQRSELKLIKSTPKATSASLHRHIPMSLMTFDKSADSGV